MLGVAPVLLPLLVLLAATPEHVGDGKLHVQLLDVGYGDALLVVSPTGRVALVDGGPADGAAHLRTRLTELLKPGPRLKKGAHALDLVVVTQGSPEHFAALGALLRESPPRTLVLPPSAPATLGQLAAELKAKGTEVTEAGPAPLMLTLGGDCTADVLAAGGALAVKIGYQGTSIWVMGDAPALEEKVAASEHPAATLLVATAHGAAAASDSEFVKAVHPDAVFVSCGPPNDAEAPDRGALERLAAGGARVFRTDLDGDLSLESDGSRWTVVSSRAAAGAGAPESESFPATHRTPPRKGKR